MYVKKIEVFRKTLRFKQSLTLSFETVEQAEVLFLKLTGADGSVGVGSAAIDTGVTKESLDKVQKMLLKKLPKSLFKFPLSDWYRYHLVFQNLFEEMPLAQMASEEALLNLYCNSIDLPLRQLFGGYRESCNIAMTIGIEPYQETIEQAKEHQKNGFKLIKLKCGVDLEEDIKKIKQVDLILKKDCRIILDPNRGYSFAHAKKLLQSIEHCKVALIEQPVEIEKFAEMKKLKSMTKIPIIADEMATDVEASIQLLVDDVADGVNIKLMKCGGAINFIKIFHAAKLLKKIVMIGCTYESNISITTGASLALALPIDFVDLDSGKLDFEDDPTTGGVSVTNGKISVPRKVKLTL